MPPTATAAASTGRAIDPETLANRAHDLFMAAGLTCSEAILQAGCEALGIADPLLPGIALGLGGGVGQQGATCGILTGAALCVSAAVAHTMPEADYAVRKRRVMAATAHVMHAFQTEFQHTDCRRICGIDLHAPTTSAKAKATLRTRVCDPRLMACARVLAHVLAEVGAPGPDRPEASRCSPAGQTAPG